MSSRYTPRDACRSRASFSNTTSLTAVISSGTPQPTSSGSPGRNRGGGSAGPRPYFSRPSISCGSSRGREARIVRPSRSSICAPPWCTASSASSTCPTPTSVRNPTRPDVDPERGAVRGQRHPDPAQERAVAPERDDEVQVTGALGLFLRAPPGCVQVPDVDVRPGHVVFLAPGPHPGSRLDGHRPATVDDDADPVQDPLLVAHAVISRVPFPVASAASDGDGELPARSHRATTTAASARAIAAPANTTCSSPSTDALVAAT